jgi:GTP-binding protein YchF
MSLSIGIVGLPNVGKSTLFRALTKNPVDISNYPFCTIEPNVGIVKIPDERLELLVKISKAQKIVPAVIKFVDIAGLVKGAAKGQGLGNQFLAHIREVDVILHIVRCFKAENVIHIEKDINPRRDIEIVNQELILKDLETIKKRIQRIEKETKSQKKEVETEAKILENLRENLEKGEMAIFFSPPPHLFLLTAKPQIYLLNSSDEKVAPELEEEFKKRNTSYLLMNLREELDISELEEKERKEFSLGASKMKELIKKCYQTLNLITFFTIIGEKETRAWPIKSGTKIIDGAEMIHNDFAQKFIMALVVNWKELVEIGGWKGCQEKGILKEVGRNYILQDGDVIEVKHN